MSPLSRRELLQVGAGLLVVGPRSAVSRSRSVGARADATVVNMASDGLDLSPLEQAVRLHRLAERGGLTADRYSLGGVVEELESAFASLLGKEMAVFMPTGTLANQLAVRALAGGAERGVRVLVPAASHIYNDTGDGLTAISGFTMVPLARDSATITLAEVEAEVARARGGRVETVPKVLVIESPMRRRDGQCADPAELARVVAFARAQGMGLHLDGARLLIASACMGIAPATLAAPFDTVYVSLYKGINAPSGAILAGPRRLLEGMYHTRRMFGGGLPSAWPFAAAALDELPGFVERLSAAVRVSEQVFSALAARGVTVRRVPQGTNVAFIATAASDPAAVQRSLATAGIDSLAPSRRTRELPVLVNESWSRRSPAELTEALAAAALLR